MNRKKYASDLLKKFRGENCKTIATPLAYGNKLSRDDGGVETDETSYRRLIGSLLYHFATGPGIMYATSLLSRFMHNPFEIHLVVAKRVLMYVKRTLSYGLKFNKVEKKSFKAIVIVTRVEAYVEDTKSTNGCCFSFRSAIFA
ncbi:Uncharacterized protein TCM_019789 [Theobroma cacao]|uniref:Cysteine-rich RLK (RECEPTOR-like protein kinase) 8 n=1 Tax=Theobroma cacao TaxID=3641 RepID=A0A061EI58_THECC|nr:Uncharacterized protein TCM_019789 [Theobroma cacao]